MGQSNGHVTSFLNRRTEERKGAIRQKQLRIVLPMASLLGCLRVDIQK
jgi:hypothetical protein